MWKPICSAAFSVSRRQKTVDCVLRLKKKKFDSKSAQLQIYMSGGLLRLAQLFTRRLKRYLVKSLLELQNCILMHFEPELN